MSHLANAASEVRSSHSSRTSGGNRSIPRTRVPIESNESPEYGEDIPTIAPAVIGSEAEQQKWMIEYQKTITEKMQELQNLVEGQKKSIEYINSLTNKGNGVNGNGGTNLNGSSRFYSSQFHQYRGSNKERIIILNNSIIKERKDMHDFFLFPLYRILSILFDPLRDSVLSPHYYYELYIQLLPAADIIKEHLKLLTEGVEAYYAENPEEVKGVDENGKEGLNVKEENTKNGGDDLSSQNSTSPVEATESQIKHKGNRFINAAYDYAQHSGRIVPRVYSMALTAAAASASCYWVDVLIAAKGVQHHTRGLFLRYFILTMSRNTYKSASEGVNDLIEDEERAEWLLRNLREMTWLWMRMEASGITRHIKSDRRELKLLVGMNIVYLSELKIITKEAYKAKALNQLLFIVQRYREGLAQQYLLEVIVQVFPDEFHLCTLELLLSTLTRVASTVDVYEILRALMDRLGNYIASLKEGTLVKSIDAPSGAKNATEDEEEQREIDQMAGIFLEKLNGMPLVYEEDQFPVDNVIKKFAHPPERLSPFRFSSYVLSMYSLAKLALRIHQVKENEKKAHEDANHTNNSNSNSNNDILFELLSLIVDSVAERFFGKEEEVLSNEAAIQAIERLLGLICEKSNDINIVLRMDTFEKILRKLPFGSQRAISIALSHGALKGAVRRRVETMKGAKRLLLILSALVYGNEEDNNYPEQGSKSLKNVENSSLTNGTRSKSNSSPFYFCSQRSEEIQYVCQMVHLIHNEDPQVFFDMLTYVRKLLRHAPDALPTLVNLFLRAALKFNCSASKGPANGAGTATPELSNKVFSVLFTGDGKGLLEQMCDKHPIPSYYMYLSAAQAADLCGLSETSYNLYVEAFLTYERYAAIRSDQLSMLSSAITSLHSLKAMPLEQYELISTKVYQYSSKFLRLSDRSSMIALCANLFWKKCFSETYHERISEYLQRALAIAEKVQPLQQQRIPALVDILNQVLHFYAAQAPKVTVENIKSLLALIESVGKTEEERLSDEEDSDSEEIMLRKFKNNLHAGKEEPYVKQPVEASNTFFKNTVSYIRSRQNEDPRWKELSF